MERRGAVSRSGNAGAKRLVAAQLAVALCTLAVCVPLWLALSSSAGLAGLEWVNHDVGNILYLGQRMLTGDRLYADLAEANPPGIFFVAEFVAALSARLHVSPIHIFHALVLLLALFGVWVIQSVHARARLTIRRIGPVLAVAALLPYLPRNSRAFASPSGMTMRSGTGRHATAERERHCWTPLSKLRVRISAIYR